MLKSKPCKFIFDGGRVCGSIFHTAMYHKIRKPIKVRSYIRKKGKRAIVNQEVNSVWLEENPPDHTGKWECYLRISPICYRFVTLETLNIEHSYSKRRHPELRERQDLLHPACPPCNELKGSKDITDFVDQFPHLSKYLIAM